MTPTTGHGDDEVTRVATLLVALLERDPGPSSASLPVLRRLAALIEDRTGRAPAVHLSPREAEIARHIADGRSNRSIAAALFLSERTVEKHVSNMLEKLGTSSRASIAVLAVRKGLVVDAECAELAVAR